MRKRWTWMAWSMLAIFVVCYAVAILLSVANGNYLRELGFNLALLLAFAAFMVVGAVIVAHRPGNSVGWIFSAIGLLAATGVLALEYAEYAFVTRPASLPGPLIAAWYHWWWIPVLALIGVFPLLLFPTGRLLSARWRPIAAVAGVAIAAIAVGQALQPTLKLQHEDYTVRNPTGLNWVPDAEQSVVGTVLLGLLVFCALAAVFSLVVRFRHSRGVERQQLKWFTYAAALMIVCGLLPLPDGVIEDVLFGLTVAFVPISAGVAILRYRLYDIDRIINRTLVYGLLTVLLGAVYVGLVLALGQLFGRFGTETPSWAVAGATLAVAAMFQPARRRIQQAVDRRFNRSKYNAAKTIEGFSTRLREQVDLDTLSTELLAVVDQTMQPTTTSLWLRPSARPLSSGRVQGG